MRYIPSVNIEQNTASDFQYLITENAKLVAGNIVNSYNSGHHSFSIIGTYGTGKSSFILALEEDLANRTGNIIITEALGSPEGFEFLNIVGDYAALSEIISTKLGSTDENPLKALHAFYQKCHSKNKFLVIVIDEFGKILEHAAKHDPEKELYFLQKLSEFVNVPTRRIILLTTLHQNFGSYSYKLNETQRQEWHKVKGRFQEIVFAEPAEQLLSLASRQIDSNTRLNEKERSALSRLYELGIKSKIVSKNLDYKTAVSLYPLDPISAVCLTLAIQRYGQNERSLFSFLTARGKDSINEFKPMANTTYSIASVYDYLVYHFYSAITEMNADSMGWRVLSNAIERVEASNMDADNITASLKLIKTIGLVNMFFSGVMLDYDFLVQYGKYALGLSDVRGVIGRLTAQKIIRYAQYKSQYILFEGTNINIEDEVYKAASIIPVPVLSVEEMAPYVAQKASIASASYYATGTPRFFEYRLCNEPSIMEPTGEIDGFIQLVFPLEDIEEAVKELSKSHKSNATIYGYFRNTDVMSKHLYEIKKIQYVIDNVAFDDHIAKNELENQKNYEIRKLNEVINDALTSGNEQLAWYFKGTNQNITSWREFNKLLSAVCNEVYDCTPIIRNELFNRQKLKSAISLARVNLLDAMLNHSDCAEFGIKGFPPEKTIYYTLFLNSGMHRKNERGEWILGAPTSDDLKSLWDVSVEFIESATDRPRKISELVKILKAAPYKLKQGVIEFWIPIFLYVNQQDIALYNGNTYVLKLNKEFFELLQKRIGDFSVKTFKVSEVKQAFFKRYRQFLKKDDEVYISSGSLLETVKPFFKFYKKLNNYAKNTRKFDSAFTVRFRDVLSNAQDPVKTFFEDLPAVFGYKDFNKDEFLQQYIDLINKAIHELNFCYDNLIDRIEEEIVDYLGLPFDYEDYKAILESRYKTIDSRILTPKTRSFLDRVKSPSDSKREFIEKLAIVINDRRLDETTDSDEPLLIHDMLHLFGELERYSSIGSGDDADNGIEAYNFELASNKGEYSGSKTYRLPSNKSTKAEAVAQRIKSLLTDDEELNVCILLKILNEKMK